MGTTTYVDVEATKTGIVIASTRSSAHSFAYFYLAFILGKKKKNIIIDINDTE